MVGLLSNSAITSYEGADRDPACVLLVGQKAKHLVVRVQKSWACSESRGQSLFSDQYSDEVGILHF